MRKTTRPLRAVRPRLYRPRMLAAMLVASLTMVFVTAAPASAASTCKSITNGTICVGPTIINGAEYMQAWYTVSSSGHSVTGHVELARLGAVNPPPCTHGTATANSVTVTLAPGERVLLRYGQVINYSNDWAATFWAGSGTSFTDYGTVCAEY